MKSFQFYFAFIFSLVAAIGCNKDDESAPPSSEASISSCSFNKLKDETKPYDQKTNKPEVAFGVAFTVNDKEGVIENGDSLAYKTDVSKLFPAFLPDNRTIFYKINESDKYQPVAPDTFWDFTTQKPVFIKSIAPNGIDSLKYTLKVKVHQVDPDSVIWTKLNDFSIWSEPNATFTKAIVKGDSIYYFIAQNGFSTLYTSGNGENWEDGRNLENNMVLKDVLLYTDNFYGLNNAGQFIYSEDGLTWETTSLSLNALLFSIGSNLLGIKDNNIVKIVKVDANNFTADEILSPLPANFPTAQMQSCVIKEREGYEIGYVMGGITENNYLFVTHDNGQSWENLSTEGSTRFAERTGAGIVSYDNKLWIVGGGKAVATSLNKGKDWQIVEKWQTQAADIALPKQTTVVFNNSIFAIGTTGTAISAWKGRMNKMDFAIQ